MTEYERKMKAADARDEIPNVVWGPKPKPGQIEAEALAAAAALARPGQK